MYIFKPFKALEELGKLAKMVSNTQWIDAIERRLGELDAEGQRSRRCKGMIRLGKATSQIQGARERHTVPRPTTECP